MQKLDILKISLQGTNLIEASAGTGKTYTLVNLYLRLLLEQNLTVDQILVVTFTEAATKELRGRLRENLELAYRLLKSGRYMIQDSDIDETVRQIIIQHIVTGKISTEEEEQRRKTAKNRMEVAVTSFDQAAVFTIHGFCQRMLSENAFESNLPFEVELNGDTTELVEEVVFDFWRQHVYQATHLDLQLLAANDISLEGLQELARQALQTIDAQVIKSHDHCHNDPAAMTKELTSLWTEEKEQILEIINCKDNKLSRGAAAYKADTVAGDALIFDQLADNPSFELIAKYAISNLNLAITKAQQKKGVKAKPHAFFDSCEQCLQAVICQGEQLRESFIDYVRDEVVKRNRLQQRQTFDDLLLNLRRALQNDPDSHYRQRIRSRYKAAMIDEFQDTDPVQLEIFHTVFMTEDKKSPSTLFLIGDPKQSIYKFRGADIFAYLNAKKEIKQSYTLGTNYRSETGMIRAVNHFFIQNNKDSTSNINPFMDAEIPFQRIKSSNLIDKKRGLEIDGKPVKARLCFLKITADKPMNKALAVNSITTVVSQEIVRLLQLGADNRCGFKSPDTFTPLMPQDIAVLVQSHKQASMVQQALQARNVPCVLQSSGNIFASTEAEDMFFLLAAVATPSERTLLPLLLSPLLGHEISDLYDDRESMLERSYEMAFQLRDIWIKNGFTPMFHSFLTGQNVRQRLLGNQNGERMLTNILHLAELIHEISITSKMNIQEVIDWLNTRIESPEEDEQYVIRLEKDDNAVTIQTVHSSKGLEFPVVFSPFEWTRLLKPYFQTKVVEFYDVDSGQRQFDIRPLAKQSDSRIKSFQENIAENIRLLYVAITRGANLCYVGLPKYRDVYQSALGYLLQEERVAAENYVSETIAKSSSAEALNTAMMDEIDNLSKQEPELIAVQDYTVQDLAHGKQIFQPQNSDNKNISLHCPEFSACIDTSWGIGSFSALIRNISHSSAASPKNEKEKKKKRPLLTPGPDTGNALHEILEEICFSATEPDRAIIERKICKYGLVSGQTTDEYKDNLNLLGDTVATLIKTVLQTPISQVDNLRLAQLRDTDKLAEMEFYYPVADISRSALARVFAEHASPKIQTFAKSIEQLSFSLKNGYMNGFIDLMFSHNNKYYVLDWKSNFLGNSWQDYSNDAIEKSMTEAHYILQYHLYVVATHLYLKARLADYSYEDNFGGVLYVYLRGIDRKSPGNGIYFDRPTENSITALSKALGVRI